MTNQSKILYRTNYFQREWTWITRILATIFLGIGVLVLPLENELLFVKLFGVCLVVFYYIAKPKDDLAVTDKLLLHIKRSAITKFTRVDQYEISELISI